MNSVSRSDKRRYNGLPLYVKLHAVRELESGTSVYDIANDLNVHSTTVRSWQKNKQKFNEWSNRYIDMPMKKKRLTKEVMEHVNKALWIWFRQKRSSGVPLSGPTIQSQALKFNNDFGGEKTFSASNGWLRSWKERYSIKTMGITPDKLTINKNSVNYFDTQFQDYVEVENLSPDQIFFCDEIRLNYKSLPKTLNLSIKTESCSAGFENLISVMICCNISGTCKLPLVIIGETDEQEKVNMYSLPVSYYSRKSAWITKDLFAAWFNYELTPGVKAYLQDSHLPNNALLIMDMCYIHNSTCMSQDEINVMFYPENTTAVFQPKDQGYLENLKLIYKEYFMQSVIDSIDKNLSLADILNNITIEKGIDWLAAAWDKLSTTTIQSSWNRVWPWTDRPETCTINQDNHQRINNLFCKFCDYLQRLPEYVSTNKTDMQQWFNSSHASDECLTDDEIVEIIREEIRHIEIINNNEEVTDIEAEADVEPQTDINQPTEASDQEGNSTEVITSALQADNSDAQTSSMTCSRRTKADSKSTSSKTRLPTKLGAKRTSQSHENDPLSLKHMTSLINTSINDDAYDTFGKHVANELRKYNSETLAYVKKAINDVLFEADIGRIPTQNHNNNRQTDYLYPTLVVASNQTVNSPVVSPIPTASNIPSPDNYSSSNDSE